MNLIEGVDENGAARDPIYQFNNIKMTHKDGSLVGMTENQQDAFCYNRFLASLQEAFPLYSFERGENGEFVKQGLDENGRYHGKRLRISDSVVMLNAPRLWVPGLFAQRVVLTHSNLEKANLYGAIVTGTLTDVNLDGALVVGADFSGVEQFNGLSTRRTLYDSTSTRWPEGYEPHPTAIDLSGKKKDAYNNGTERRYIAVHP
jgi:hypothetical protein